VTDRLRPDSEALLLDEHFPPALASLIRDAGFDVIGVAEDPAMRGACDDEAYGIAVAQNRRVVTENVRDFRPLLAVAIGSGAPVAPLLLTTAKRHPRNAIGHLETALMDWLRRVDPPRQNEEWL